MQVQVHYQGLDNSPWMDQFIKTRVAKLERFLNQAASVQVNIRLENRTKSYVTSLVIHNHHDYAFSSSGLNLFESFSLAIDKASRALGEQKRKIKDKINRNYFSIKKEAV